MSDDLVTIDAATDTDTDTLDGGATLRPYSDGRIWREDVVVREIHLHLENIIISAWEVGRRLIWTKHELGHGRFVDWCDANLPHVSERTLRRYMQVAAFLTERPALLKPMARAGLKRTLLLTTLAPDQVDRVVADGHLAETPIDDLDTVPYAELQKQVRTLKEERDATIKNVTDLQEAIVAKDETISELAGLTTTKNAELLDEELDDLHKDFDSKMERICLRMDLLARRWESMPPALRAKYLGFAQYMQTRITYEVLGWRRSVGEEVWQADLMSALQDPRPFPQQFPVPPHRLTVVDGTGTGAATAKTGRR